MFEYEEPYAFELPPDEWQIFIARFGNVMLGITGAITLWILYTTLSTAPGTAQLLQVLGRVAP